MEITEAKKKLNVVRKLIREFEMLDSAIKTMELGLKAGLYVNMPYLNKTKKRRDKILSLLDNYLK